MYLILILYWIWCFLFLLELHILRVVFLLVLLPSLVLLIHLRYFFPHILLILQEYRYNIYNLEHSRTWVEIITQFYSSYWNKSTLQWALELNKLRFCFTETLQKNSEKIYSSKKIGPSRVTMRYIQDCILYIYINYVAIAVVHDEIIVLERKADWAMYEGLGFSVFIITL